MLKEYASPLTLELSASVVLNAFLIVVHALAVLAVLYAQIDWTVQMIFVVMIGIYFIYQKQSINQSAKLIWFSGNDWHLYLDGEYTEARLTSMSFHSSWLIILAFKARSGRRVNVPLLYDALDAEVFRRLKVRLTILKPKDLLNLPADE